VGDAAGQAAGGVGDAAGQLGQGGGENGNLPSPDSLTGSKLAKQTAKLMAKEIGSAASDEAKDLGLAATRKVMELGERRRQRRAEKPHATEPAMRQAKELGVDLDEVEGTGADGRITVRDIKQAAEKQ
jgi:pyruvate/2-oxoglutarate dehydrogenase complex dihydrolipoamide acyltransferase (E2) component